MLTTKAVEAALKTRPATGQRVLRDKDVPGLTLVVGKVRATWTLEAMAKGKRRKIVIGGTDTHALDEARTEARRIRASLHTETPDQVAERVRRAKAAEVACDQRLKEHVEWMRSGGLKPKTIIDAESQTRLALSSIGMMERPPSDITEQHLRDVIAKASKGTRRARYGYLSRFLKFCSARGYVKTRFRDLDLEDFEKPSQPTARERVLSMAEIGQLLAALKRSNSLDPVFKDIIRFLVLVPARKNEAANARTRDINVEGRYLELAGSRTKNGQPHRFHLGSLALDIVKARMGAPDDLLFPAPRFGGTIQGWTKLKSGIDAALPEGFDPWVLHDLRRSFASHMADAGIDETVVDLILNHKAARSRGGITGVYVKAGRWQERVAALDLWNDMVAKVNAA